MTDLAAAIGLHQVARSAWLLERRRAIAPRYTRAFSQWPEGETPCNPAHVEHAWHLYILRLRLERLSITPDALLQSLTPPITRTTFHFLPHTFHPFNLDTH